MHVVVHVYSQANFLLSEVNFPAITFFVSKKQKIQVKKVLTKKMHCHHLHCDILEAYIYINIYIYYIYIYIIYIYVYIQYIYICTYNIYIK